MAKKQLMDVLIKSTIMALVLLSFNWCLFALISDLQCNFEKFLLTCTSPRMVTLQELVQQLCLWTHAAWLCAFYLGQRVAQCTAWNWTACCPAPSPGNNQGENGWRTLQTIYAECLCFSGEMRPKLNAHCSLLLVFFVCFKNIKMSKNVFVVVACFSVKSSTCICVHAHAYTCTCAHTHTHAHTHPTAHAHTHSHTHTHTHTHTRTHTHTHSLTHTFLSPQWIPSLQHLWVFVCTWLEGWGSQCQSHGVWSQWVCWLWWWQSGDWLRWLEQQKWLDSFQGLQPSTQPPSNDLNTLAFSKSNSCKNLQLHYFIMHFTVQHNLSTSTSSPPRKSQQKHLSLHSKNKI